MGKNPKSHSRYPSANKSGSSERKSSKDAPNLYSKTVASEDPRRAQNLLAGCIFDGEPVKSAFALLSQKVTKAAAYAAMGKGGIT